MKAKNFDSKIDAGDEISDTIDWSKASRPNAVDKSGKVKPPVSATQDRSSDPGRSFATAEMPEELREIAAEALERPYEP